MTTINLVNLKGSGYTYWNSGKYELILNYYFNNTLVMWHRLNHFSSSFELAVVHVLCLSHHSNTVAVLFAGLSSGWAITTSTAGKLLGYMTLWHDHFGVTCFIVTLFDIAHFGADLLVHIS